LFGKSFYGRIAGVNKERTYAEALRRQMESRDNRQGRPITTRELAAAVQRSYELCRLVLAGRPVVSRDFNEAACRFLGLDVDQMWQLAVLEKTRRRFGLEAARRLVLPPDDRLVAVWRHLSEGDRERVIRVAQSLANRHRTAKRREAKGDEIVTLIIT
jgi:hypothetical protein